MLLSNGSKEDELFSRSYEGTGLFLLVDIVIEISLFSLPISSCNLDT